jgi:glycosyltransferase involved in cell wall biosynthesis
MAARLPLVVTDVGGNGELVRDADNGYLVPYGDPRALAERLGRLLASAARRREMGARGRARVEADLSIDRMRQAYGDLYRRLLQKESTEADS